jgi:hypothetical protein
MALPSSYIPLESGFAEGLGITPLSFQAGQASTLFSSASFITSFLFILCIGGAAFVYARGGLWRMQASDAGIRKSNEEFTRATLGLLGVLILFPLLFLVNKDLLSGNVGLDKLKIARSTSTPVISSPSTPNPEIQERYSYSERLASHNKAVSRLAPSGIHTNHGDAPCTEAQFKEVSPSCTSLAYLSEQTIQLLININSSCKCTLVITGATEPGHSKTGQHKEGGRAVDLKIKASQDTTDPLYKYIKGIGNPNFGGSVDCFMRYTWNSFTFCDEKPRDNSTWGPHFHVQ